MTNNISDSAKRIGRGQLVKEVSQKQECSYDLAKNIVTEFLNVMTTHISHGQSISLMHDKLGRFDVVLASKRKARNFRTKKMMQVPAHLQVKFVPSNVLKQNLKDCDIYGKTKDSSSRSFNNF